MIERRLLIALVVAAIAAGCGARQAARTNQRVAPAPIAVGAGQTYLVRGFPPAPLREPMPAATKPGQVWLDGYWDWNGTEWQWRAGRWVTNRPGYVYVSPYYDYGYEGYTYRTGYWARKRALAGDVYLHRPSAHRPLIAYPRRARLPSTAGASRRFPGRFRPPKRRPAAEPSTNRAN